MSFDAPHRLSEGAARTVVLTMPRILHYRVPLFQALRARLSRRGIRLRVVHGDAQQQQRLQRDLGEVTWSEPQPLRIVPGTQERVAWLAASVLGDDADLFVVPEAAGWLPSYELLLRRRRGNYRVACWGHGPGSNDHGRSRFTRWARTKAARQFDWWFSYADGTTQRLVSAGVDSEQITTLYNTVDVKGLRLQVEKARAASEQVRERLSLHGPTAVYLGALRADKRLDLLLAAAERIASQTAGFTLVVGGDGPERKVIDDALATSPWLRYAGPVFGRDKAAILAVADVLVQPVAMGLVVLDAYAAGLPVVTFDRASHGPEEEYLRDGVQGVRVPGTDPTALADAVVRLLHDTAFRTVLARGAMTAGLTHSIEDMARRFAEGIEAALR